MCIDFYTKHLPVVLEVLLDDVVEVRVVLVDEEVVVAEKTKRKQCINILRKEESASS